MSADDYVFVLESPTECVCGAADYDELHTSRCPVAWGRTEWRVRHTTGAYWEDEDEMIEEFSRSGVPVFYDKARALIRAHDLADNAEPEYGVRLIRTKQPILRSQPQDV